MSGKMATGLGCFTYSSPFSFHLIYLIYHLPCPTGCSRSRVVSFLCPLVTLGEETGGDEFFNWDHITF